MKKPSFVRFVVDENPLPPFDDELLNSMTNIIDPHDPQAALNKILEVFRRHKMLIHGALIGIRGEGKRQRKQPEITLRDEADEETLARTLKCLKKAYVYLSQLEPKNSSHVVFGDDFLSLGGKSERKWENVSNSLKEQITDLTAVQNKIKNNKERGRPEVLGAFEHLIYVMALCYEEISGDPFRAGKLEGGKAKNVGMKFCETVLESGFVDRQLFTTSSFQTVCEKVASRLRQSKKNL